MDMNIWDDFHEWGNVEEDEEEEDFGQVANEQLVAVLQNDPTLDFFDLDFEFGDDVATRVGAALKTNVHLQWISVTVCPSLTIEGATALANGIHYSQIWRMDLNAPSVFNEQVTRVLLLSAVKTIRCLCLGFQLSDIDAVQLGESLVGNKILQNLRVLVHDLTAIGAQGLSSGIRQSQIRYLRLEGDSQRDSSEVVKIILRQGVMLSATIQHLSVGSASCIIDAATIGALQSLTVDSPFHVPSLSEGLSQTSLVELKLGGCGLGDTDMKILSLGLRTNTSITLLILSQNHIADNGVSYFVENWNNNSPIEFLALSWNEIGSNGIIHLLRASVHHPSFTQLCVENNKNIGYNGLHRIGVELPLLSLKSIYLRGCAKWINYGSEISEASKAQEVARFQASQSMLKGVRANVRIQLLRLELLLFMEEIQFYVEMNRRGRHLTRHDHGLAPAVWCHIMAKQPIDSSIIFCFLREQPTLVSPRLNNMQVN